MSPQPQSVELWTRYAGVPQLLLTVVLAAIALALLAGVLRLRHPVRPPVFRRSTVRVLLVAWPVSIVAFLVAVSAYAARLVHDYPDFASPQSPILPVTLSAVVLTFVVLAGAGRGTGGRGSGEPRWLPWRRRWSSSCPST